MVKFYQKASSDSSFYSTKLQFYQILSPTAAGAMKIIVQLAILTLSLSLANAYVDDRFCSALLQKYKENCTSSQSEPAISSCCDYRTLLTSGVYKTSRGTFDKSADTYCDMKNDDGGWIVIQRNKRGSSISFDREWIDYEKGFGNLSTEFWYGLEEIHCLTQRGQWEMRLDYQKTDNSMGYLHYKNFSVGSANEEYPLHVSGFTGQGSYDPFTYHSTVTAHGQKFSTSDNDNDQHSSNCAQSVRGWWHNRCTYVYINYQPPQISSIGTLLYSEMKIRPIGCSK